MIIIIRKKWMNCVTSRGTLVASSVLLKGFGTMIILHKHNRLQQIRVINNNLHNSNGFLGSRIYLVYCPNREAAYNDVVLEKRLGGSTPFLLTKRCSNQLLLPLATI